MDHSHDYQYWKQALAQNPAIFSTEKSFKHELACYRDDWRAYGVIVETGTGELRKRVLLSPSRYIDFYRDKAKGAV